MMKTIYAICGALLISGLHHPVLAQPSSSDQIAVESIRKMKAYQDEASKKAPLEIYQELERVRTAMAIKNRKSAFPDLTDEDSLKGTGYAAALEARRKQREPAAALYWGIYNSRICDVLELNKSIGDTAKNCWVDTLESFRIASDSGIARASFNIGLMYENGWGVTPSKLVASDWYIKAAERYNQTGSRESALEALEAALRVVPDLPAGQRLKAQLIK